MNLDFYDFPPDDRDGSAARGAAAPRAYIGVLFECCGVYVRIYRQPEESRYHGRCPRCLRMVSARVGAGGTRERLFRAE